MVVILYLLLQCWSCLSLPKYFRDICCCQLWLLGSSQLTCSVGKGCACDLAQWIFTVLQGKFFFSMLLFTSGRKSIVGKELCDLWFLKAYPLIHFSFYISVAMQKLQEIYTAYRTLLGKEKGKGNLFSSVLAECKTGKAEWGWAGT